MIVVELVDGCNLRCVLCWNRNRKSAMEQMSLDTVERVLQRYKGKRIDWYNWGEPLLYKDFKTFAGMVKGTRSCISTNLSVPMGEATVEAMKNFYKIYVSLSGLTEEVQRVYHVDSNFDLIVNNLKLLVECCKKTVTIRWLSHPQNLHQRDQLKDFCIRWDIKFEHTDLNCEVEELVEGFDHPFLKSKDFYNTKDKKCRMLTWPVLGVHGEHLLCCATHNVPINHTVDEDLTTDQLAEIKGRVPLCKTCQERELWRMF